MESKYCNVSIWNGRNANATSKVWIPGISIKVGVLNVILSSIFKVKETVQMEVMSVRLSVCDLV
jgi:ribosomal protein S9